MFVCLLCKLAFSLSNRQLAMFVCLFQLQVREKVGILIYSCLYANIVCLFLDIISAFGTLFECSGHCLNVLDIVLTFRTPFQRAGHCFNVQHIASRFVTPFQGSGQRFNVRDTISTFRTTFQCMGHRFNVWDIISMFRTLT